MTDAPGSPDLESKNMISEPVLLEGTRICTSCCRVLLLSKFAIAKGGLYGHKPRCKECINRESSEKRREKKKEDLIKVDEQNCGSCEKILPADSFYPARNTPTGLSYECISCHGARIQASRDWQKKKKMGAACVVCGYNTDWRALEFAHLDRSTKLKNSKGKPVGMSKIIDIDKLEKEWLTVRILCKICHRKETKEENDKLVEERKDDLTAGTIKTYGNRMKLREIVNIEKMRRGCCPTCKLKVTIENCQCFEFDHRNPLEKTATIAYLVSSGSQGGLEKEMELCDLLCVTCHYIKSLDKKEIGFDGHATGKKRKLDQMSSPPKNKKYAKFIKKLTKEKEKMLIANKRNWGLMSIRAFHVKCKAFSVKTLYKYVNLGFIDKFYKSN